MRHEDEAALRLCALCQNEHMHPTPVKEGKIELVADCDGLFQVDVARLNAINGTDDMMVATRHTNTAVRRGDKLAGTRIIPLVIEETRLRDVEARTGAGPILSLTPWKLKTCGLITTGSEVADPRVGHLPPGMIYGSNLALLTTRLGELGIREYGGEQAADDSAAVALTMERLQRDCDVLITTGGMSVGDRDIFHEALPLLGAERVFWRVKLKPGTPAMFSRWRGKPVLSLSGNPFAAATFEQLARPLLAALAREPGLKAVPAAGVLADGFPKASPGRRFLRGRYQEGKVRLPQAHSSGVLSSLVGCNCLVDVPAGSGPLTPGQTVDILLL